MAVTLRLWQLIGVMLLFVHWFVCIWHFVGEGGLWLEYELTHRESIVTSYDKEYQIDSTSVKCANFKTSSRAIILRWHS